MLIAFTAVLLGLILLVWSADRFIDGAAATAKYAGMPPLLIGMVIIGFGTSAPELFISALAASQGNPGLALGNGYGSNIANIGLILGLTALLSPIVVHKSVLRKELPILAGITLLSGLLLLNGQISRVDAGIMLLVFALIMGWSIYEGLKGRSDPLIGTADAEATDTAQMTLKQAIIWLVVGLILLIISSRALVWGAVEIATSLGVSDLIIGLTVVAIGTSLPELASAFASIRKGEHDLALGNVIGSNLFNTLAVIGLAGMIHPLQVESELLWRDWPVMAALTLALFVMGYGFRGRLGRINRFEGALLLSVFIGYTGYLLYSLTSAASLG
ncbi:Inner membrane protein YrbG, predicted calcium/sodium:proton antiporter [Nitrincola lacisaponensis]|uniref:Inner membrane protein YrbG, predicted calcium/sodium:proton antiporter n=1 Tax=Nitrincola lacisaponensis TaxID=267850 RepID=A0A063Y4N2_9GAMM|nr:calcium/sodium antiporter [Nitrincola lacisaponensis]KDE41293.1 Inner membrane protein YrbG, predicted calcium/sodium:proton antiporter [Nitrincola lacisaponensis]